MSERLAAYKFYLELKLDRKKLGAVSGEGFQFTSMQDQDGIIQEIFKKIGTTNKTFIEFGAGDGLQNNTLALLTLYGWKGLWLEAVEGMASMIEDRKKYYNNAHKLTSVFATLNKDNIDELLLSYECPEPDLLSIDTDWNDYYLWEALENVKPRVIVIEYNSHIPRNVDIVVPYGHNTCSWNGSSFYGASIDALIRMGKNKGYTLVGTNIGGSDAFFIRNDCLPNNPHTNSETNEIIYRSPWNVVYEHPLFDLCYQVGHKPHAWCNEEFVEYIENRKKEKAQKEELEAGIKIKNAGPAALTELKGPHV